MERGASALPLREHQVRAAVVSVLPEARVLGFAPLRGGRSNHSVRVDTHEGPLVLRLYSRGASIRDKEAALGAALEHLPTPRWHGETQAAGQAANVFAFLPGRPLAQMHGRLDDAAWRRAGQSIGSALASMHSRTFAEHGDLVASEGGLTVQPWPFGSTTAQYVAFSLRNPAVSGRLGPKRADALVQAAEALAEHDDPDAAATLTHGDFNPTNILVAQDGQLTGILDWEYAHAGAGVMDLGNLFRKREHEFPALFEDALVETLDPGPRWRQRARWADLSSALEFLSRPAPPPDIITAALEQLDAFLRANA